MSTKYGKEYGQLIFTNRFMGLLLIIGFTVAMTILYQPVIPFQLYIIMAIVLGYISSMYLLIELSSRIIYRLKTYRVLDKPLVEGKYSKVKVKLVNNSLFPILFLEINDLYPSLFKLVDGSNYIVATLPGKGFVELEYVVEPRIGSHVFHGVEVIVRDPMGLFAYKAIVPESKYRVYVHPKPYPISRRLLSRWISTSLGLTKSKLKGIGTEFITLREYVYGDDYRFIDWKSYARLQRLYVKMFEREASLNLMLILDASPAMLYGVIGKTMLEESIRVISGIASVTLERGDWVGLAVRSIRPLLLRQGRGRVHYGRLLRQISMIEWSRKYPDITMAELIRQSLALIPRRAKNIFLVFLSLDPTVYPKDKLKQEVNELIKIHYRLASLNHSMIIVSPLPELYEIRHLTGFEAALYLATSYRAFEKARSYAYELQRNGIRVIQVGPSSLLPRLIRFIETYRSLVA